MPKTLEFTFEPLLDRAACRRRHREQLVGRLYGAQGAGLATERRAGCTGGVRAGWWRCTCGDLHDAARAASTPSISARGNPADTKPAPAQLQPQTERDNPNNP